MPYYDYSTQAEHDRLVEEIKGYWLSNGWRLSTLMNKSTRELIGIRNTMLRRQAMAQNKAVVTATQKQRQTTLFDKAVDTKVEAPKPSPIRRNQYRQIILLDEED